MQKNLFVFFSFILFTGCSVIKAPVQPTKQTFTFDYIPKTTNKSGSAKMVLASLKPYYAKSFTEGGTELFKSFQTALGGDIEELIISKGFSMKGPYVSYDEMIFEDKKRVDVAVVIEISPEFVAADGGWKEHVNLFTKDITYSYEGTASLIGKINLSGLEPLTGEKIWSKSVQIPNVENIKIATTARHTYKESAGMLLKDPGVYNAIGTALQSQYIGIMEKIATYFNVEEFQSLKGQITELKSKKGF